MRYREIHELLACACELSEEEHEQLLNDDDFEDLAFEKFGCDVDTFSKIAEALLKLTPKIETAITKDVINAFVSGNRIIIKGTK